MSVNCIESRIFALAEFWAKQQNKTSTLNSDKYRIMKQRNWQCDITRRPRVRVRGVEQWMFGGQPAVCGSVVSADIG